MPILNKSQFRKLSIDQTNCLERVQWTLQKIKNNFAENKYKKLYLTGSRQ